MMDDLDTSITAGVNLNGESIGITNASLELIVVVVDDDRLTDNFFELAVVLVVFLTTPLDELLETSWLHHDTGLLPFKGS